MVTLNALLSRSARYLLACSVGCVLSSCALFVPQKSGTTEITIFSLNDFHGHIQASKPVPYNASIVDTNDPGKRVTTPAGGYAHLTTLLNARRAAAPNNIFVAAGDMIGASPIGASLLNDEPVIEALNRLQLTASSVGNHEFDAGSVELLRKIKGDCEATGCAYPDFRGSHFSYLAANVVDRTSGKAWLPPYIVRQVGEVKVGIIGAVTVDTPNLVSAKGIASLRFEDEAAAINRVVPELKKHNVAAIIVLIHEGGMYKGSENDPTYRCEGLEGPIVPIVKKLDPAISLIVSGHSHQAYTCKIDGTLLVQARSYGAYLTESTLTIDRASKRVVNAVAVNHLVNQQQWPADASAQRLVDQVARQTAELAKRPIATLSAPLVRASADDVFDSPLGNVVADAQLHFAQHEGAADIAFMNTGGIRADLPAGAVSFGDLYATQPFGNTLIRMALSGAQIRALLEQQSTGKAGLYVSNGFQYRWLANAPVGERAQEIRFKGKPLNPSATYRVIVNSFLADGGDGFSVFTQGRERSTVGSDLHAIELYLRERADYLERVTLDRVLRIN
jgi:5'-nucleotidase